MQIFYQEECLSCSYYDKGNMKPRMQKIELSRGSELNILYTENKILFLLKGALCFNLEQYSSRRIWKNEMLAIPSGCYFNGIAEEESVLIVIRISSHKDLNLCLSVDRLMEERNKDNEDNPEVLKIREPIFTYLSSINLYLDNQIRCNALFESKAKELFLIFRTYYDRGELYRFFSLHLTPDLLFSDMVYKNYKNIKTVRELASLTRRSQSSFQRHFIRVFGMPPYQWMQEKRAENILHDIETGNMTIKEICNIYGFYSSSHLNSFCKNHFGYPPKTLKNKEKKDAKK